MMFEQTSIKERAYKELSETLNNSHYPSKSGIQSLRVNMCLKFLMSFLFIQLVILPTAEATQKYNKNRIIKDNGLQFCNDDSLNIEFLCNPSWEYHVSDGALMIVVSSSPTVTITFTKIDSSINFLTQLNRSVLAKKKLYRKGFKVDQMKINDHDAVVVRAFAKKGPERRVLDHFFIHNGELFGALFAVSPLDDWDQYKFLIKTLSESIKLQDDAV